MERKTERTAEPAEVTTLSGIPLKVVYTQEDIADLDPERDLGLPGQPPYTRGIYATMYRGKPWTIRQYSGFGTPEETNARFRMEYEMGQTGFSVAFDAVSEAGLDPDDPRVFADVGQGGVPCATLEDMEVLFRGLPIERVSTAVVANPPASPVLTAMYFVMAKRRGIDLKALDGTTQNDLLLTSICTYTPDLILPRQMLRLCVDLVEWCVRNAPRWHPVSFASYNYRENGVNAWQELGILFALALSYVEELVRRGLSPDEFGPALSFHLAAHNELFEEVAKFRAGRRMWYRLMKERFGATHPKALQFRFHVQTSGSTHTYQEPLNNLVRIAYQVLSAVLGGAQSIHANSYDEALCLPTEQSVLLSIRTQQILQLETGVAKVADPLGGSYYVEWLTREVERRAWDYLRRIEEQGGLVACLESGWLHREFGRAMREYDRKVSTGEIPVVGVNRYRLPEEPHRVPTFKPNPEAVHIQRERLERVKRGRDEGEVQRALKALEEATLAGENVMEAVMSAVSAYATLGEITGVWRRVLPSWRPPLGV